MEVNQMQQLVDEVAPGWRVEIFRQTPQPGDLSDLDSLGGKTPHLENAHYCVMTHPQPETPAPLQVQFLFSSDHLEQEDLLRTHIRVAAGEVTLNG